MRSWRDQETTGSLCSDDPDMIHAYITTQEFVSSKHVPWSGHGGGVGGTEVGHDCGGQMGHVSTSHSHFNSRHRLSCGEVPRSALSTTSWKQWVHPAGVLAGAAGRGFHPGADRPNQDVCDKPCFVCYSLIPLLDVNLFLVHACALQVLVLMILFSCVRLCV
jgi:hypothetical protein